MNLKKKRYFNYFKNEKDRNNMEKYINQDVIFTNERRFFHYYNDVPYTRWPFYACGFIFLFLFYGVLYINKYDFTGYIVVISFYFVNI